MKKTLRKKFVIFAMSAVTILLVVLIGAINAFSWAMLDRQTDDILHAIASGDDKFLQMEFHNQGPFQRPMSLDTVKAARFFMVRTDPDGAVLAVNLEQISSVSEEQAVQYAGKVSGSAGKADTFKYEVKQLGAERLIFFLDTSSQTQTFLMVLSISCAIALICWVLILMVVFLLSGRVVRPILAGMEKQKQFITNAGHELKTPLAIICSNNDASALICGETKYSRNIRQQIQRLNALMTNLLTLARLDEEVQLPTEAVNITDLIRNMLPAYEELLEKKKISLLVQLDPDTMLQVHADTFSQMISVLLDNAVNYTTDCGTVRLFLGRDGKQTILVEENTCNFPRSMDPERLFDRFYRGNSARTQDSTVSGYGIGLSAARSIAETFGGTLDACCMEDGMLRFTARF